MTPVPKRNCTWWDLTLLGGYLEGARHMALWRSYYPEEALLAYAGGGGLVRVCRKGPWLVRGRNICLVAWQFRRVAQQLGGSYEIRIIARGHPVP
jgi:hypothetical protein